MTRRAVILAGGRGRRLAPYTFVIPKPIVPIGTTPILEIVLRQLARDGFGHVTIALGHLSEIVRAVAGDGSRLGLRIDYSDEEQPLGTMGPLRRVKDLPETFLVMNADVLTDLSFDALWRWHQDQGPALTVATYVKQTRLELGVLETDGDHSIVGFAEKPVLEHRVSMGIYVLDRRVVDSIPDGRAFGFDDLMLALLAAKSTVKAYPFQGRWLDIGNPADYERAQEEFEQSRARYLPDGD
jgi:NDP-sugar pyrophosphorylase family protein